MKPYLSIIIPAYNEALRLPLTLLDIDRYLETVSYPYEILVVDDASEDGTGDIVRKMSKTIAHLKYVASPERSGKGAVVRRGMRLAQGKIRLFTDADNSTAIEEFSRMEHYLRAENDERFDVVIGSRAVSGSSRVPPQPFIRECIGRLGNLWVQCLLLSGIWDTQCGFKAFTGDAAERIFALARVDGWGFDIEALALARRYGYRIKEMPVRWANHPFSHVRGKDYLQVFLETITIRWWLMRGVYEKAP